MIPILAGLLTFAASAVAAALLILLAGAGRGLNVTIALVSLIIGCLTGAGAWWQTRRMPANRPGSPSSVLARFTPWTWAMSVVFALFALRTFCWLIYTNSTHIAVGSPNNLGDISLHMLLARDFANGVHWWPAHPQAPWLPLRYYPGIDLLQALLLVLHANEFIALVWVGLIGSLLTLLALQRWGGSFAIAGFLFSGGFAGFRFLSNGGHFADFQADLAWKSLPLAIFVTQRPFLFALPAGLLLMCHWREKFFGDRAGARGLIPFWVEWLLYAIMPAFHLFAFGFLSLLLGTWFLAFFARREMRWHLLRLVGTAFLPATGLVWLMTGHFAAAEGAIKIQWGWMQHQQPFFKFWLKNFGLFALLAPALWGWCAWDVGGFVRRWWNHRLQAKSATAETTSAAEREAQAAAAFVLPAGALFVVTCCVLFAVWEWDNTKLMIWCYLAALPFIWNRFLRDMIPRLRSPICVLLFFSGAVSLAGGLGKKEMNFTLLERAELASVRLIVRDLPVEARFAAAPDYNHPLVYCGRNLAMGYEGHLNSQGINYRPLAEDLDTLMNGANGWRDAAARLQARYIFWGPRETKLYPNSTLAWANPDEPVAKGDAGTVYEIRDVAH